MGHIQIWTPLFSWGIRTNCNICINLGNSFFTAFCLYKADLICGPKNPKNVLIEEEKNKNKIILNVCHVSHIYQFSENYSSRAINILTLECNRNRSNQTNNEDALNVWTNDNKISKVYYCEALWLSHKFILFYQNLIARFNFVLVSNYFWATFISFFFLSNRIGVHSLH